MRKLILYLCPRARSRNKLFYTLPLCLSDSGPPKLNGWCGSIIWRMVIILIHSTRIITRRRHARNQRWVWARSCCEFPWEGIKIWPYDKSTTTICYLSTLHIENEKWRVKGKKLLVDALYRSVKRRLSKLVCNRLIQISMASQDSGLRADYTQDNWLFRRSWCSGLNIPEN